MRDKETSVWWSPSSAMWFFCLVFGIYIIIPSRWVQDQFHVLKYLSASYLVFTIGLMGFFMGGTGLGRLLPGVTVKKTGLVGWRTLIIFLSLLGIGFTLYWFGQVIDNPAILFDSSSPIYMLLEKQEPPATLLVQGLTLPVFSLGVLFYRSNKDSVVLSLIVVYGILLCLKSFVWSTRLLLFEVAFPVVITWAATRPTTPPERTRSTFRLLLTTALGVALVIVTFSVFESARTWRGVPQSERTFSNFASYGFQRFVSYYVTSQNNAAAVTSQESRFQSTPTYFTFRWFWVNSVLGLDYTRQMGREVPQIREDAFVFPLKFGLNPSYNVFAFNGYVFLDYKWSGWGFGLAAGVLVGYIWKRHKSGSLLSMMVYPSVFTGLLETARINYFGEPRFFYSILGSIVVWCLISDRKVTHSENSLRAQ